MKTMAAEERNRSAGGGWTERLNDTVRVLADRLPGMIGNATMTYERLAARELADDAKSVAAQQAALRSALAHLEALLNLARRLNEPGVGGLAENNDDFLEQLCSEATAAVALLPEEPED